MPNTSTYLRNARLDAAIKLASHGWLEIMSGKHPKTADDKAEGDVLVAIRLDSPAAAPAKDGMAKFDAPSAKATGTGKAAWYRVVKSDGETTLWTGLVGVVGHEINLPSLGIAPGVDVEVEFTVTEPTD